MNLQERIKKVLREETNIPLYFKRRVSPEFMEDAFQTALDGNTSSRTNPNSILYKASLKVFANFVIDDMIEQIEDQINIDGNFGYHGDDESYIENIRRPFLKHYGDRIRKRWNDIESFGESVIMEVNDRAKNLIRKYVNEMGLSNTSKMMGLSKTKIVEIANIPIDSEMANDLLLENMRLKNLKREYKEFDIRPSGDGIFYWGASTNTGHFLPDMIESIAVVATPFWDGEEWTPVELDWYTLLDGDGKAIIEVSSDGSYFRKLKHQTHFNSIKELFNWYEEYYLPTVYDVVMNDILPNVHQQVDDEIDNRGGYK